MYKKKKVVTKMEDYNYYKKKSLIFEGGANIIQ